MFLFALVFSGCDADCDDPARINGSYAAFHAILNIQGEANESDTAPEDTAGADASKVAAADEDSAAASGYAALSYSIFANGWSRWNLTRSASTGKLKITAFDARERMGDPGLVDGQPFIWSGDLVEHADNCNIFDVSVRGEQVTSRGTTHSFVYEATMSWQGTGLAGVYTYADTFVGEDGSIGAMANARGEVILVKQASGGFDTGF